MAQTDSNYTTVSREGGDAALLDLLREAQAAADSMRIPQQVYTLSGQVGFCAANFFDENEVNEQSICLIMPQPD